MRRTFVLTGLIVVAVVAGAPRARACPEDAQNHQPAQTTRIIRLTSREDVVDQITAADDERLQAWCAESGRTGDAIALRVINPYSPDAVVDVSCAHVASLECTATSAAPLLRVDDPTDEAGQKLSPFTLGCFLASLTVGAAMTFSCSKPGESCSPWASWGGVGALGSVCLLF